MSTEVVHLSEKRRDGNTTRLIDKEVQELFTLGRTFVWDHADRRHVLTDRPLNKAHDLHFRTLMARLRNEHGITSEDVFYDSKTRVLSLKNKP